mmetsp:Transcript_84182/g.132952  ORF Transcript_84182/g.132952 Transcript_84182/m.132952 type:complete len:228 (+) Transcript_84182:53-736(+)
MVDAVCKHALMLAMVFAFACLLQCAVATPRSDPQVQKLMRKASEEHKASSLGEDFARGEAAHILGLESTPKKSAIRQHHQFDAKKARSVVGEEGEDDDEGNNTTADDEGEDDDDEGIDCTSDSECHDKCSTDSEWAPTCGHGTHGLDSVCYERATITGCNDVEGCNVGDPGDCVCVGGVEYRLCHDDIPGGPGNLLVGMPDEDTEEPYRNLVSDADVRREVGFAPSS